jgi:hypothetical protein
MRSYKQTGSVVYIIVWLSRYENRITRLFMMLKARADHLE